MQDFRHNLTPVEVKRFLKISAPLTENLLIRYCYKIPETCPQCGHGELCKSAAVSLFSNRFDKLTHELVVCLKCEYRSLSTLLSLEML
jgi:hypothetical protein|uniref:Uncharacterized protein n=1 Tax=Desulfobacca acetoxidans TaxID=60893 RepID=A0A7C5EMR3_9BACT